MFYVLQKVCCTSLQSSATKKIIPSYIREFAEQLLKNATQTIKSLLTFQPKKMIPHFLPNIKTNQLNPKGDMIPTIPFPENVTCA